MRSFGQSTTDFLMGLTTFGGPQTCDPYKSEDDSLLLQGPGGDKKWKVSHGTPTITSLPFTGDYKYAHLNAFYRNGTTAEVSEGLFIGYTFQNSHLYDIQVLVAFAGYPPNDDKVALNVFATNTNLVEKPSRQIVSCPEAVLPVVADVDKKVVNQSYPLISGNYYLTEKWTPVKALKAFGDFTQLWIYPDLDGAYQTDSWFEIERVTIFDLGLDPTRPTMPGTITSSNVTKTGFTISWGASTDNAVVAGYNVYVNGVKRATVYTSSYNVTGLTSCTAYNVEVRAFDGVGESGGRTKTIGTAPEYPAEVILDQPDIIGNATEVKAGQTIYLRPGFIFQSAIPLGTTPPIYRTRTFKTTIVNCGVTSGRMAIIPEDTTASPVVRNETRQVVKPVEANHFAEASIEIYPNPFTDEIKVDPKNEEIYSITIYESTGAPILTLPNTSRGKTITVSLKNNTAGLYLIEVMTGKGKVVKKIVKK